MYKVGAVIVAAGLSSRMGSFKPMLPWGNTTVIREIIQKFKQAGVEKIVVVTGFRGEQLEQHLEGLQVQCIRNEYYDKSQMFDSAKIGFSELAGICQKVFFMPTDIPLFQVQTLKDLIQSNAELICPSWQRRKGHPLLMSDQILTHCIHYTGEQGLHGALASCGTPMEYLNVDDWGILYDMDTRQDYERLQAIQKDYERVLA